MRRLHLNELVAVVPAVAGGCVLVALAGRPGGSLTTALLAVYVPIAVAGVVKIARQARRLRLMTDALETLSASSGMHVYSGIKRADDTYRNVFVGPGGDRFSGPSQAEWLAAIDPRDFARYREVFGFASLAREEPIEAEFRMIGADGTVRWVVERVVPRQHGHVVWCDGVVIDQTRSRAQETEVAYQQAALARLVEATGARFFSGRFLADGTYESEYSDPGMASLAGIEGPVDPDELQVRWARAVHPDDRAAVRELVAANRRGETAEGEYRLIGEDGVTRSVLERTHATGGEHGAVAVRGFIVDRTERLAAERELARTRGFLERIIDEHRTHVYAGRVLHDGTYVEDFTGPGLGRIVGSHVPEGVEGGEFWSSCVHPDDRASYDALTAGLKCDGPYEFPYRVIAVDGTVRHLLDRGTSRPLPDGSWAVEGIVTDVTEHVHIAGEARVAHERLHAILGGVGMVVYSCDVATREAVYMAGDWSGLLDGGFAEPLTELRARVHPDDRPVLERFWQAVAAGREVEHHVRIVGCDGAVRWLRERAVTRDDDAGRLLVDIVAVDVTAFLAAEAALGEARARIASIVETIEEFLFTIEAGPDGFRVEHSGPGFERLVGGEPARAESELDVWRERLHPDDLAAFLDHLADASERQSEVEVRLVGYDGVTRWVWIRSRPRPAEDRLLIDGIVSDVTERVLAAEALERLSGSDPLTGIANRRHFSDLARAALDASRGGGQVGVILFDIDHFKRVNDVYGHAAGDAVMRELVERVQTALPAGAVAARWGGEEFAVLVERVGRDRLRRLADRLRAIAEAQAFSFAGVDLSVTISCGGAVSDGHDSLDVLLNAADQALYAAKRRGRNRTVLADELVDADLVAEDPEALRIAEAMARATAAREGVPEQHCHRVAELAVRVGSRMGLSSGLITRLRIGGWLHDIGKIAIPDRILSKPGKLDTEEWEIMKSHTILGMRLVEQTPGLAEAALAVAHHHERWDGAGYPYGLAGLAIPMEARIVAAVDAWSAMTEDRPYRPGLSFDAAIAELHRVAGSQLDPEVARTLAAILIEETPAAEAAEAA